MPPARYNSLKIAAWLLVGICMLSLGLGGLSADPGHNHEPAQALSDIDTSGNPHCPMPDSVKVQQECEQELYSLQQALPQRETALLSHLRIDKPSWIANIDLAGVHRERQPPPKQRPYHQITLPTPIPPRLSFCCLRT